MNTFAPSKMTPAPERETRRLAHTIRRHVVEMTSRSGASHIGSCMSIADILAVLYGRVLNVRPNDPDWPDRDRFILSKGHAAAALYATLAERGFIARSDLESYYLNGSNLMGHASHHVPGVELSTGSLGHGLPVAAGIAYGARLDGQNCRTFALLSDGECDEGSIWEAAMFSAFHNLANLTVIIDYNKIQSLASTFETLDLEPFAEKWKAFRWDVREIDGHDHEKLYAALTSSQRDQDRPQCIIAHTVKGKGISFMENKVLWHYRAPRGEELAAALRELEATKDA